MKPVRWLAIALFTCLLVWSALLESALRVHWGGWTPQLALALSLSVLSRAEERDWWWLLAGTLWARGLVAAEPAAVVLAGTALVLWGAFVARGVLDLAGPAGRALAAVSASLCLGGLSALASFAGVEGSSALAWAAGADALRAALGTGLCALLLGGLLQSLPGLGSLARRAA
jgi:hypothetical protein